MRCVKWLPTWGQMKPRRGTESTGVHWVQGGADEVAWGRGISASAERTAGLSRSRWSLNRKEAGVNAVDQEKCRRWGSRFGG